MAETECRYIWRCAKCHCHFANIIKSEGIIKQEKKCPKCKSINTLTLTPKDIYLHCKSPNGNQEQYHEQYSETYNYMENDK